MKVLLISDSHIQGGLANTIKRENADFNLHMGDSQFMKNNSEMQDFDYTVRGNCDFEKYDSEVICEIDNQNWLLIHGHQAYNALDLKELANIAKSYKCGVICYGHTHIPVYSKVDDVIILNPGSFARSRCQFPNSYMTIDIDQGEWKVELKFAMNGSVIKEFKLDE